MNLSNTVNSTLGCVRIRVPQQYYCQPIFSRLISRYCLTINIAAAYLEAHINEDGWFDLEIQGSSQQVEAGLAYLKSLNIEIVQLNFKTISLERMENIQLLCLNRIATAEDLNAADGQSTRAKLQVCIPQNYRSSPVIAGLVSCYGLTVNIAGALLDDTTEKDGWFDLELWGNRQQIVSSWKYFKQLGLQIWL
ncbi:NIL domain-containing protein [Chlorogloeopsis sp. ULAP02]|uniref:NIL domain-containing protein n=1 Tax=Chlorogloeopsis sp. ULAP02 TaxID=3107926 RepID=UPI003136C7C0